MLLTSQENENGIINHYVWIKNFDKLNFHQIKCKNKKHFCRNCIQEFSSKEVLEKHKPLCITLNGEQGVGFPEREVF